MEWIQLDGHTIENEHICCAIADIKCRNGYQLKKEWLKTEFSKGYVFRRLDARAKVFIEYGPAETFWCPVDAPEFLMLGCFWVSGRYKKQGYGKALLQTAKDDAVRQGKRGLVTVAGRKKMPFMSDAGWLIRQGFKEVDQTVNGFVLLSLPVTPDAAVVPRFAGSVKTLAAEQRGYTVYYSNRCPFTDYYVSEILPETAAKRNLKIRIIKLDSVESARTAPTPATIFSLFLDGKFVTTDISVCLDNRFDKLAGFPAGL